MNGMKLGLVTKTGHGSIHEELKLAAGNKFAEAVVMCFKYNIQTSAMKMTVSSRRVRQMLKRGSLKLWKAAKCRQDGHLILQPQLDNEIH